MLIVRVRWRWILIRSTAITIVRVWQIVVIVMTSIVITSPLRLVVSVIIILERSRVTICQTIVSVVVTIILVPRQVIVELLISGVVVSIIITLMGRLSSRVIRRSSKGILVTSTSTGSVIIFLVIIAIRGVILLSPLIVTVIITNISARTLIPLLTLVVMAWRAAAVAVWS